MNIQTQTQPDQDSQTLSTVLVPYLVDEHGRARGPRRYWLRLRSDIRLKKLANGSQLLEESALYDALWDAKARNDLIERAVKIFRDKA